MIAAFEHRLIRSMEQPRDLHLHLSCKADDLLHAFVATGFDSICRENEPGRWQAGLDLLEHRQPQIRIVGYILLLGAIKAADIGALSARAATLREALLKTTCGAG